MLGGRRQADHPLNNFQPFPRQTVGICTVCGQPCTSQASGTTLPLLPSNWPYITLMCADCSRNNTELTLRQPEWLSCNVYLRAFLDHWILLPVARNCSLITKPPFMFLMEWGWVRPSLLPFPGKHQEVAENFTLMENPFFDSRHQNECPTGNNLLYRCSGDGYTI